MKRVFPFSFQHRVVLIFLLIMNLSFLLTGYLAKNMAESTLMREKEGKLIAITRILDKHIPPGGFDALLKQNHAEGASREEKIRTLNRRLRDFTDEVGQSSPSLGVGYYSRDLDAILTYGPSISFGSNVGVSIAPTHPGREVMRTNTQKTAFGSMVRGDIMNAMLPIDRGGKAIGYIWANELTTDISEQLQSLTRNIFLVMLGCSALFFILLLIISRRTLRDVDLIIDGVRAMKNDLSTRIKSMGGDMGEVVDSINDMAVEIGKATEESNRAISVMQSVMSNVDAMIMVCDPHTHEIVFTNNYLADMIDRDDLEGKKCHEVLYGNLSPCTFCASPELFDENGNPIMETITREVHNDLLNQDFLMSGRLVTWHDGRLLHMEVGTNITERNALVLAEAANQAQRDFLARISHEIRMPMNNVLGVTHLAMEAVPPPSQLEFLKKIENSANELLEIINDILDFSRIEAGMLPIEKQAFRVREVLDHVAKQFLPRLNEQYQDFHLNIDEAMPEYVVGDGLRFSQVLLNLLLHSARYTINGSISLNVSVETLYMGMLKLDCLISDTGVGMSKEQMEMLFDPFAQSEVSFSRHQGGSKLGLPISKSLIEMMGGDIEVSSKVGVGTEFSFFIVCDPLYGSVTAQKSQTKLWQDFRYDGARVLLVESHPVNQEIAKGILIELGATVDVVPNGVDAIRSFLVEKNYDMILMDARMPVMDGLETTRRIRASKKEDAKTVPIVAMTASVLLQDRLASKDAGIDAHISKPVNEDELKEVLYQQIILKKEAQERDEVSADTGKASTDTLVNNGDTPAETNGA